MGGVGLEADERIRVRLGKRVGRHERLELLNGITITFYPLLLKLL